LGGELGVEEDLFQVERITSPLRLSCNEILSGESWKRRTSGRSRSWKGLCGTDLKCSAISRRSVPTALPVRSRNGVPAHRQFETRKVTSA
jgi:hypothetical protein